jgi:ubiquitin C-terminal hydrolase
VKHFLKIIFVLVLLKTFNFCFAEEADLFSQYNDGPSCGITNAGNDCFLAAATQLLYVLKPFNKQLLSLDFLMENVETHCLLYEVGDSNFPKNFIPGAYLKTIKKMRDIPEDSSFAIHPFRDYIVASSLEESLQNMVTKQQDAYEFVVKFIEEMYKEKSFVDATASDGSKIYPNLTATQKDSIKAIEDVFSVNYRWKSACSDCPRKTNKDEPSSNLRLNIFFPQNTQFQDSTYELQKLKKGSIKFDKDSTTPNTTEISIEELLEGYIKQISNLDDYKCDTDDSGCGQTNTTTRTVKFIQAPELLFLNIRRFEKIDLFPQSNSWEKERKRQEGVQTIEYFKIFNTVFFPLKDLNFGQFLDSPNDIFYDLVGVVIHDGDMGPTGTSSGHYFAYVREGSQWYLANDSNYRKIDTSQVQNNQALKNAYVLIYERKESATIDSLIEKLEELKSQLEELKKKLEILKSRLTHLKTKIEILEKAPAKQHELRVEQISPKPASDLLGTTVFDQKALDAFALGAIGADNGYGYKVANLRELKIVGAELNSSLQTAGVSNFDVQVPEFVAISSAQIKKFLLEKASLDINLKWKDIQKPDTADLDTIFESKKFPDNFVESVLKISEDVKTKFDELSKEPAIATKDVFDAYFKQDTHGFDISTFIEQMAQSNNRLVVRSTGAEDTTEIANAGGNESVLNVKPSHDAVLMAMGKGHEDQLGVVASYFGKKSLCQRLGLGDRSLFSDVIPLTSVLIQKMVGEKAGGEDDFKDILVSGVIFTEYAEGGAFQINNKKQVTDDDYNKTSGLTLIQATWGHGEAVVNGICPVDSYYIDPFGNIFSVIRDKNNRLVPNPDGIGLKKIENPPQIRKKSSLGFEAIMNLKLVAKGLEEYYKRPMDVEFVYHPGTKKISIVQARPITYKSGLPSPSYLDTSKLPQDISKTSGSSIVFAGGSVRKIENKKDIIATETLEKALIEYINSSSAKDVKCVITNTMAPATSHEATTFRGEGIPVFCIEDSGSFDQLKTSLEQANVILFIDLQQELVVDWTGKATNPDQIDGWFHYPIPRLVSLTLPPQTFMVEPQRVILRQDGKDDGQVLGAYTTSGVTEKMVKDLTGQTFQSVISGGYSSVDEYLKVFLKGKTLSSVAIDAFGTTNQLKQWSNDLKSKDQAEAKQSLAKILYSLLIKEKLLVASNYKTNITAGYGHIKIGKDLLQRFSHVVTYVFSFAQPVCQAVTNFVPHSTSRIFPIRLFEASLFQQPQSPTLVKCDSVATVLKEIKFDITAQAQLGAPSQGTQPFLYNVAKGIIAFQNRSFSNVLSLKIEDFAKSILAIPEANHPDLKTFLDYLKSLQELDLLTLWLNAIFSSKHTANDAVKTIQGLNLEFGDSRDLIVELNEKMSVLNSIDYDMFADHSKFTKTFSSFSSVIEYFKSDDFVSKVKASKEIGKLACVQCMNKVTETFDFTIKAVKSNAETSRMDIVKNFKIMLRLDFNLLVAWLKILDDDALVKLAPADSQELFSARRIENTDTGRVVLLGDKTKVGIQASIDGGNVLDDGLGNISFVPIGGNTTGKKIIFSVTQNDSLKYRFTDWNLGNFIWNESIDRAVDVKSKKKITVQHIATIKQCIEKEKFEDYKMTFDKITNALGQFNEDDSLLSDAIVATLFNHAYSQNNSLSKDIVDRDVYSTAQKIAIELKNSDDSTYSGSLFGGSNNFQSFNLNKITLENKAFNEILMSRHLFGSTDFDVSAFTLGNGLQISVKTFPWYLEDAFTTMHQDSLAIISNLALSSDLKNITQPQILKNFTDIIPTTEIDIYQGEKRTVSVLGISIDATTLTYHYNLPLAGHSCMFEATYTKTTIRQPEKVVVKASILFQGPGDFRKENLKTYITKKNKTFIDSSRILTYEAVLDEMKTGFTSQDVFNDIKKLSAIACGDDA